MIRYLQLGILLTSALVLSCSTPPSRAAENPELQKIKLPPGFTISVYAENVPNARQMALGPNGTLFVGSRSAGNVYAVVDTNKDNKADQVYTIARRFDMPSGVAFRNGSLYVAEVSRITRYDDIESRLSNPPNPVVVSDRFPNDRAHGWKFIAFGPDGKLHVPIGAPCNICIPSQRHANISRIDADGSNFEIVARGVRNSVGFDWDPRTRELWFTDNGRDGLGDNIPPDELNHVTSLGEHFGYPYCHAGTIQDPELGKQPCSNFTPPAMPLGPHVAAIGMRFYTGQMFPEEYRNQIFIAEHGSWNRSVPLGYRISVVRIEGNKAVKYEQFAEGWLQGDDAWGRPADVLVMPDGALLISDDELGVIYRIAYSR
jgi:glucose/arabinose dehydrogenase